MKNISGSYFFIFISIINLLMYPLQSFKDDIGNISYYILGFSFLFLYLIIYWNRAKRFKYGNEILLILFFGYLIFIGSIVAYSSIYFTYGSLFIILILNIILTFKNATKT